MHIFNFVFHYNPGFYFNHGVLVTFHIEKNRVLILIFYKSLKFTFYVIKKGYF